MANTHLTERGDEKRKLAYGQIFKEETYLRP